MLMLIDLRCGVRKDGIHQTTGASSQHKTRGKRPVARQHEFHDTEAHSPSQNQPEDRLPPLPFADKIVVPAKSWQGNG